MLIKTNEFLQLKKGSVMEEVVEVKLKISSSEKGGR